MGVLLVLVLPGITGFLAVGPTGGAGPSAPPSEGNVAESSPLDAPGSVNLGGGEGKLVLDDRDIAWIDLAFRMTQDLGPGDIAVNVTFTWEERAREDNNHVWACGYFGPRSDIYPLGAPAWMPCSLNGWKWQERQQHDGTVEAGAQVLGAHAEAPVPNPCINLCWGNRSSIRLDPARFLDDAHHYDLLRERADDPDIHLVFVAGGLPPANVHVEAEWKDTELFTSSGGFEDTFTFYRDDDFRWDVAAHVEHPPPLGGNTFVGRNGELTLDLAEEQVPAIFGAFIGNQNDFWRQESATLTFPDGTVVEPASWAYLFNQSGPWTFHIPESEHKQQPEEPAIHGSSFEWATVPWDQ